MAQAPLNEIVETLQDMGDLLLNNGSLFFKTNDEKTNKNKVLSIFKKNKVENLYVEDLKKGDTRYPAWMTQWIDEWFFVEECKKLETEHLEELREMYQRADALNKYFQQLTEDVKNGKLEVNKNGNPDLAVYNFNTSNGGVEKVALNLNSKEGYEDTKKITINNNNNNNK